MPHTEGMKHNCNLTVSWLLALRTEPRFNHKLRMVLSSKP